MRAFSRIVFALWVLMGAALFISLLRVFWPYTVDDSFITLRYGRNVFEGLGPVFNPGERAEGYTCFAWMLFTAAIHALPFDPELSAKLGSLLATVAGVGVTAALAGALMTKRDADPGDGAGALPRDASACAPSLAAAFVLAYLGTAVHAVSAMETALYTTACTALFLWAVRLTDRAAEGSARDPAYRRTTYLVASTALLLGLVRPDGNLVATVTAAVTCLRLPRPLRRDLLVKLALVYVLPGAVYFIWRWRYYGYALPLPFYVKAEKVTTLAGAEEAWSFVADMLWGELPIAVLAVLGAFWQRRRAAAPLIAALALFAFYLVPTPLMAYNHRYLHPLVPLLAALAGVGFAEARTRLHRRLRRGFAHAAIDAGALAVFALLVPTNFLMFYDANLGDKRTYAEGLRRAHMALAREFAKAPHQDGAAPTMALLDSGALPYVSRWRAIDTFGLNDPYIARGGRGDAAYVLDQRPDALILISSRGDRFDPVYPYESRLYEEAVRRGYSRVEVKPFAPDYQLWVFAPHGRAIWQPPIRVSAPSKKSPPT